VALPDAPFLVGELSPAEILQELTARVYVDNDVNWAARAERSASAAGSFEDAVYLYLGEGLGGAVISDAEVRRGHRGLGGEVMHLLTVGPSGRACTFTEVFARAGLRRDDSPAVDLEKIDRVLSGATAGQRSTRDVVARAIAGICSAIVGLVDPEVVVLGGPWGINPALVRAVTAEVALLPRPVQIRPASVIDEAPLQGARADAVQQLRGLLLQYRTSL
jgi:predicted NBD/HSP70 family sugar kinase